MGLANAADAGGVTTGKEPVVTLPLAGMVMGSPQDGQSICEPAPDSSTAISWSQFGQLKTMSIISKKDFFQPTSAPAVKPEKNHRRCRRKFMAKANILLLLENNNR